MKYLRPIYDFAKSYLKTLLGEGRFDKFILIIAIFVVATHTALMSGLIHSATDSQAVIGSIDNDAGIAIDTAIKTQVFNNNGFTAYGPTYYRAVRILDMFLHDGTYSGEAGRERSEKAHHFLLMLVSYFSLLGTAFIICFALFDRWILRLLGSVALTSAFLNDPIWALMIFRAHPDHLLAFSLAIAALMTWKSFSDPGNRKNLLFASAAWGFVASVKMTIMMFAPVFILFFLPIPPKQERWTEYRQKILILVGGGAVAYFAFGFPQSLDIVRVLGFLVEQKRNILPGDWESLQAWLTLFWQQLRQPVLILTILAFALPLGKSSSGKRIPVKSGLLFFLAFTLPIIFLISRKVISPFLWYPLPFIAALMTSLAILYVLISKSIPDGFLPDKVRRIREHVLFAPAVFIALAFCFPTIPSAVHGALNEQLTCRAESKVVEAKVNAIASAGHSILADPYIPYSRQYHDKEVHMAWEMAPAFIVPAKTKLIALHREYYRRYIPQEEGGNGLPVLHIKDVESNRAFYKMFFNKDETVDPLGQHWKKTHSDACSFELWELQ